MNWDAISAIADVVGVLAVIVTVVYLALQIRQNTRSVRAATEQNLMSQEMEIFALTAEHANVYRRGNADLSSLDEDEALIHENLVFAHMSQLYSGWVQFHHHIIPEPTWRAYVNGMKWEMENPGFRARWLEVEHTYPTDFQAMVRQECGPGPAPAD